DGRVEGELHLIDGHAVRIEIDGLLHAGVPVLLGLAKHAGDQIDVDLRKSERPRVSKGLTDLRRAMRASVDLEDSIVEVLDAEAQPRDAQPPYGRQLGFGERSRLALEGDFVRAGPRGGRRQPRGKRFELLRRQKRRRTSAEID